MEERIGHADGCFMDPGLTHTHMQVSEPETRIPGPVRILLVDDETDYRAAILRRLKKRGLDPEQADSGAACLAVLEKQPIDVVVLDVKMPGMGGIEVLQRIKEKYPKTEVILLTGQASTQDGVEGMKAGAFDYLSKPVELEHLLAKVEQAYQKILYEEEKQMAAVFKARMAQQMIVTERLASLGTLAVGVAHEINNPLAIIGEAAGWMNQLLEREASSDFPWKREFHKALAKIETAILRARRITHQLLGLVKTDDSVFSAVSLSDLFGEAIDLVTREASKKDIQILSVVGEKAREIWTDPYRLRQVLINLLSNAVYASPHGGRITIRSEDCGHDVRITVDDAGSGIPKENLDKIFEPFFSTKKPGEGTGLGLFVSRGIVEKLGGDIRIESILGKGTSASVRLAAHGAPMEDLTENRSFGTLD